MFEKIKNELYFKRMHLLLKKGINDGNIIPFDDKFYQQMRHTYVDGLPVSIHIKYLRPNAAPFRCYERSLYMFFCFLNAILVRGNRKDLELKCGKEKAFHGWIEIDDYCYDPTSLMRFKKETYYEIYKPSAISKITHEEYKSCEYSRNFYEEIVNTKLSDMQPHGTKRIYLSFIVPLVLKIAEMENNESFKKELDDYLKEVLYDEAQVEEESKQVFQRCSKDIDNKKRHS